ncbi:MAG: hypothetical protein QOI49_1821 [Verrucomicrobiota bacterium]|jgi:hypothetical protein
MSPTQLHTLLAKTHEQTLRKQLKWKAVGDGSLRVDFPRSSIEILQGPGEEDFYLLNIYNSSGSMIAQIDSNASEEAHIQLPEMYSSAYSLALEVDATVQDLLAGLEGAVGDVSPGIYVAHFSGLPNGQTGSGLALIGNGNINGGDAGYLYKGTYEISARRISCSLKITRWDPSATSIFGNLASFDLKLTGQFAGSPATLGLEGNVVQFPNMRLRLECRRLSDASV